MKILRILYYTARRADRRRILSRIEPTNPDVPSLVLSEHWYNEKLKVLLP